MLVCFRLLMGCGIVSFRRCLDCLLLLLVLHCGIEGVCFAMCLSSCLVMLVLFLLRVAVCVLVFWL